MSPLSNPDLPQHAFGVDDIMFSLSLQILFQMLFPLLGHFN